MHDQIIDTWHIHNRINLYLLDAVSDEVMSDVPAGSKGRTVGEQFAHMHNVRLMWLKSSAPALMDGVEKIEKESAHDKSVLKNALSKTADAVATMLAQALEAGKLKGFKPHPMAFLGYLISHESHHRGQITLALKQSGHKIDQRTMYGMWEWGSR